MLIYNMTIHADQAIAKAWLQWLLHDHIPEVMQSGCFTEFRVVRLLEIDDTEGPTYAIQFHAASRSDYNKYMELFAPAIRRKAYEKWGDQFIAFSSLMEVVQ